MANGMASTIGARARQARERLGLLQAEVAERVGISLEVYGRFERGTVTPRIRTLLRLCEVLRVTPNDLLLGRSEPGGATVTADPLPPELRQLVTVLDGADPITVRRLVEVARWLRPASDAPADRGAQPGGAPRLARGGRPLEGAPGPRGPTWSITRPRPTLASEPGAEWPGAGKLARGTRPLRGGRATPAAGPRRGATRKPPRP